MTTLSLNYLNDVAISFLVSFLFVKEKDIIISRELVEGGHETHNPKRTTRNVLNEKIKRYFEFKKIQRSNLDFIKIKFL